MTRSSCGRCGTWPPTSGSGSSSTSGRASRTGRCSMPSCTRSSPPPVSLCHRRPRRARSHRRPPGWHGPVEAIKADRTDPAAVLEHAGAALDLAAPVAVLLTGVLHWSAMLRRSRIVAELVDAVVTESHVVVSHLARDVHPGEMDALRRQLNNATPRRGRSVPSSTSGACTPVSIWSSRVWSSSTSGAQPTCRIPRWSLTGGHARCGSGSGASHDRRDGSRGRGRGMVGVD